MRSRGPWLLAPLLLLLLAALVPDTRAAFSGASSVTGAVSSAALADRLEVVRDGTVSSPAAPADTRYVAELRPRGGGLLTSDLGAARKPEDGASATITETGSDRLRVPANGGLDVGTDGWTASTSNALSARAEHATTGGDPGGALRFEAVGSVAGPVEVTATWTTSFVHTGGARAVSLRHDVRVVGATGLAGTNVLEAVLVAPGGAATTLSRSPLAAGPASDGAGPWRIAWGRAPGDVVKAKGTYLLQLVARLSLAQGSEATAVVLVDDVALDVTSGLLVPEPANRTFDTGTEGWTSVAAQSGVPSFSPSDGEPVGSMRVSVTGGTLAATGTVDWSTTFEHVGGSAGRATLALSHRILLGNEVTEKTGYTVRLHEPSGAVTDLMPFQRLVPGAYPGLDPAWTRRLVDVPASALDETGTYRLSVFTEVYTKAVSELDTNLVGLSIGYDNIVLERVATGRHVDVEAVVPVAFRSAAQLEWRAAASGDPVNVDVWSSGAWRRVGSISSSDFTTSRAGLSFRADAAEAEVRVRLASASEAVVDDVLQLDFLRVVPTDPPLLASDTDLVLPSLATGATASSPQSVVHVRNRSSAPLTLSLATDAPVLAWAGFDPGSGGATCAPGWTDGVALSSRCTLPPGVSVAVDVRVVGGRAPGEWSVSLVLSDADRPGYFRMVLPGRVTVGP